MLKFFVSIIISICFLSNTYSQNSFTLEIKSEYGFVNSRVFQIENFYYLLANRTDININVNPYIDYSPILFKINEEGVILDSLTWENPLHNAFFNEIIDLGEGTFALIGSSELNEPVGHFQIFYFILDDQLNIISENYHNLGTGRLEYTFAFLNSNNKISIATVAEDPEFNGPFKYDKLLMEFSIEGELLYDSIYDHSVGDFIYDFIPNPIAEEYLLFCSGGFGKSGEINRLDTNYNLIESIYSVNGGTVKSLIKTSDNDFISSAIETHSGNQDIWLPSFRKYSQLFEEIAYVEFGSADTISWPASYNSISSIDYHRFYGGYTFNIDAYTHYSSKKSYFLIYSIDKDLNLNWNKFYGGDAYYQSFDILADRDNGCLLTGRKYTNGSSGPFRSTLMLLKFDENGLITSTDNEIDMPIKNAIITPNPGKDYLQFHSGIYPAHFQMYHINGQMVLEEAIHQNSTQIQTSQLSSSTYIWKLIKDGQVVESGKWVKE